MEGGLRSFGRRAAACPASPRSSRRDAMARAATIEHPRKHLASGHRIRRSFSGRAGLPAIRPATHHRRRSRHAARDLLPAGLLDVVERSKASGFVGIHRRYLVPARNRRLARCRTSAGGGSAGGACRGMSLISAVNLKFLLSRVYRLAYSCVGDSASAFTSSGHSV